MRRIFCLVLCAVLIIVCAGCGNSLNELYAVSDDLVISILYCIENEDAEAFAQLFLPELTEEERAQVEQSLSQMCSIYRGTAKSFAVQYFTDPATRKTARDIEQTELRLIRPPAEHGVESSLDVQFYIETDEAAYFLNFSWVQNSDGAYGLTSVYLTPSGYGVFLDSDSAE